MDPVGPGEKQFLGHDLKLMRGTEPSNIIWENRHTTRRQQMCWTAIVVIIVIILLLASFALFTWMSALTIKNQTRYPPSTNVVDIANSFDNDLTKDSPFYNYAVTDMPYTLNEEGVGIYQAYCYLTTTSA